MATIKEVAKLAGVSVGTVSNVIGGKIRVGPDRRRRVVAAIHDLGYQPSDVARSLKLRRTNTLGLLVTDITNPFFSRLVRGAEDAAQEQGYILLTFNTDDQVERERQVLKILRGRRVDGILLVVAPSRERPTHIDDTMSGVTPLVCLGRLPPGIAVDAVTVDNVRAACKCVEHLLGLGHQRIAMITGPMQLTIAREGLQGYKQALQKRGFLVDPGLIREGDNRIDSGYELTLQLLRQPSRPTALFISNGLMAAGALKAIAALGLRCPQQIAVATFDDSPLNEIVSPPLTSVAQPAYLIGYRGAGILLDRISSQVPAQPCRIRLRAELKIRQSTAGFELPGKQYVPPQETLPAAPTMKSSTTLPGMPAVRVVPEYSRFSRKVGK